MSLPLMYLRDPQTSGVVLLYLAMYYYDTDCFEWEPELLRKEFEEDFNVHLTDLQSDKLQAAITIMTTDLYEQDWCVFETISHLLSNHHDDFENLNPAEAEEIINSLVEVELIKRGDTDGIQFSDDVNAYAGIAFFEYGMHRAPDLFSSAIVPFLKPGDDREKNEALKELYDNRKTHIESQLNSLRSLLES